MSDQLKAARFLFHTGALVHMPCVNGEDLVYQITLKDGTQHTFMDVRFEDMTIDKQDTIRQRKRVLSFVSGGQPFIFIGQDIQIIDILHRQISIPVGSVA